MKVYLAPYSPSWKFLFKTEKAKLLGALKDFNPEIEHIGSTSIEGLGAKPVIDIQVGMRKYEDLDASVEKMINVGFIYAKKYEDILPDRRYFFSIKNPGNDPLPKILNAYSDKINREKYPHISHIHMVELNTDWWKRHIAFRDYLRKNDKVRDDYYNLKAKLAENEWNDINEYADAKTEFIRSVEKKALEEMRNES